MQNESSLPGYCLVIYYGISWFSNIFIVYSTGNGYDGMDELNTLTLKTIIKKTSDT